MKRGANAILICCAIGFGVVGVSTAGGGDAPGTPARIPHLDGSGRATIVEIQPGVPGRAEFLRATPQPIPAPGELIVPPRAAPSPSPRTQADRLSGQAPRASIAFGTVSFGRTPYQAARILPRSSTRNDERVMPSKVRPYALFFPQTPNAFATA